MRGMSSPYEEFLRELIEERRRRLNTLPSGSREAARLKRELQELERELEHYAEGLKPLRA
jgi:hypothetical protein